VLASFRLARKPVDRQGGCTMGMALFGHDSNTSGPIPEANLPRGLWLKSMPKVAQTGGVA
jgi:hypothetical protein